MKEDVKKSWENFLNPETLRSNLIVASNTTFESYSCLSFFISL